MYYSGRGVTKNSTKAFELHSKAAMQGEVDAQMSLGMLYQYGDGVEQNYTKSIEWYSKAASQEMHTHNITWDVCITLAKVLPKVIQKPLNGSVRLQSKGL